MPNGCVTANPNEVRHGIVAVGVMLSFTATMGSSMIDPRTATCENVGEHAGMWSAQPRCRHCTSSFFAIRMHYKLLTEFLGGGGYQSYQPEVLMAKTYYPSA